MFPCSFTYNQAYMVVTISYVNIFYQQCQQNYFQQSTFNKSVPTGIVSIDENALGNTLEAFYH